MNHIQPRPVTRFFKKYIPGILIALITGYGAYFLFSIQAPSHRNKAETHAGQPVAGNSDISPPLINNGEGWWESNGLIYHGIPARILFFLPNADNRHAENINATAWREFERIGRIFNPFEPASEISRLNGISKTQRPSVQLMVTQDVYTVMQISMDIWTQSSGNFDPTIWPIKQLWQEAEKNQRLPLEQDINKALRSTGFGKVGLVDDIKHLIHIEGHPVMFDFGGIVKGYAVDQVRQVFLDKGISAGLIQLGGEVSAFGNNRDDPWRIGIQHPIEMDKVWGVIGAKGSLRVSTSGNYRQPIQIRGESFYHIFNPKTGWPVSEKVLGVTTSYRGEKISNARLDGIATAMTVMGQSAGLRLAEKSGVDALILYETADGTVGELTTKGMGSHYSRGGR